MVTRLATSITTVVVLMGSLVACGETTQSVAFTTEPEPTVEKTSEEAEDIIGKIVPIKVDLQNTQEELQQKNGDELNLKNELQYTVERIKNNKAQIDQIKYDLERETKNTLDQDEQLDYLVAKKIGEQFMKNVINMLYLKEIYMMDIMKAIFLDNIKCQECLIVQQYIQFKDLLIEFNLVYFLHIKNGVG